MPSVREIELRDGSIESTLARSQTALLPEEISNDQLGAWILGFAQPRSERFREHDTDGSRDPILAMLVKEMREQIVEPTLSYYHAALMHFGSQWAVANEGQSRAKALLDGDNLELSVRDANARLAELGDIRPDSRGVVVSFARQLEGAWGERMKMVTRAWDAWREEVSALKNAMSRTESSLYETAKRGPAKVFELLDHCLTPSQLSYHGFPDRRDLRLGKVLSLVSLAGLFFLSGDDRGDGRPRYYDFDDFLRDLRYAEAQRARVPIIIEEMRALEAEYQAGEDPFEPYYSEFGVADLALNRLAARHLLHDNTQSRWLRSFEASLRTLSAWPLSVDRFVRSDDLAEWIHWGAITADAEIKKYFVSYRKVFHPTTLQNAFEQEWVLEVARKLFNKDADPQSAIALRFYRLVGRVAFEIARRGYAVGAPSEERLRALVVRFTERGYFYGDW